MTTFTDEDNEEAMLKAFELFGLCMAAGPCNNCIFFDSSLPGYSCSIGCPNSWPLFDAYTKDSAKNRNLVQNALRRKEEKKND